MQSSSVQYDEVAGAYEKRYDHHQYPGVWSVLCELTKPGDRVLEVGTGTGHWLEQLQSRGCEAYGIDPSMGMLRVGTTRSQTLSVTQGKAEQIPFRNHSMDRVIVVNAIHHFSDVRKFLHETLRILRPGGKFVTIALDPSQGADDWCIYDYFPHTLALDRERYPSTQSIRAWAETTGFVACHTEVAEVIAHSITAQEALSSDRLAKEYTSQLALLEPREYDEGIESIRKAQSSAIIRGETLMLNVNIRLYATFGESANT